MIDRIAADAVMIVHLGFVIFVVFGGLLVIRCRTLSLVHVPAFVWGVWIEVTGGTCPLTPLENDLRQRAGDAGFETGFIEHYIYPLLYPPGLTRNLQMWLAGIVLGANAVIYGWLLQKFLKRKDTHSGRKSG